MEIFAVAAFLVMSRAGFELGYVSSVIAGTCGLLFIGYNAILKNNISTVTFASSFTALAASVSLIYMKTQALDYCVDNSTWGFYLTFAGFAALAYGFWSGSSNIEILAAFVAFNCLSSIANWFSRRHVRSHLDNRVKIAVLDQFEWLWWLGVNRDKEKKLDRTIEIKSMKWIYIHVLFGVSSGRKKGAVEKALLKSKTIGEIQEIMEQGDKYLLYLTEWLLQQTGCLVLHSLQWQVVFTLKVMGIWLYLLVGLVVTYWLQLY
jgi:hypothetical protein